MSLRTVAEIKQPSSPTLPPSQSCCAYSVQIELPDSDCYCQSLGLPTLHNSPKSDNLDLIAVGAKRERKSRSPTSPSGWPREGQRRGKYWRQSLSPTGQRNLSRTFASVETQTSPRVSTGRSFWTQTPPTEPPVTRSPEAYYTAERSDYGQAWAGSSLSKRPYLRSIQGQTDWRNNGCHFQGHSKDAW